MPRFMCGELDVTFEKADNVVDRYKGWVFTLRHGNKVVAYKEDIRRDPNVTIKNFAIVVLKYVLMCDFSIEKSLELFSLAETIPARNGGIYDAVFLLKEVSHLNSSLPSSYS